MNSFDPLVESVIPSASDRANQGVLAGKPGTESPSWKIIVVESDRGSRAQMIATFETVDWDNRPLEICWLEALAAVPSLLLAHPQVPILCTPITLASWADDLATLQKIRDLVPASLRIVIWGAASSEVTPSQILAHPAIDHWQAQATVSASQLLALVVAQLRTYQDLQHQQRRYQAVNDRCQALQRVNHNLDRRIKTNSQTLKAKNEQLEQQIEQLRQSEERWQLVLRGNNDGIWDWDLLTNQTFVSARLMQMLGYRAGELRPHYDEWVQRIHPDDHDWVMARLQAHLAQQTPYFVVEHRLRCRDRSYKWILSRAQALWDESGQPIRMVGSVTDISESKRMASELAEREQQYRHLVEASQDLIWSLDLTGRFTFVNQAARKIYGYEPEAMLGRTFTEFTVPEAQEKDWAAFQSVLSGETYSQYEVTHFDAQDRRINLLVNAIALKDDQGKLIGVTGSTSDETERKQALQALQREKTLLSSVIDNTADIIFYKDLAGVYRTCNRALEPLLHQKRDQIIGKTDYELFPKAMANAFREQDRLTITTGQPHRNEEWVQYPEGNWRLLDTLKSPLIAADGSVIGVIGIARDITDRKRQEEALWLQSRKDSLLRNISEKFLNQSLDSAIGFTLQQLGEFMASDRVYVIDASDDRPTLSIADEWCREGIAPLQGELQGISKTHYPWFAQQLGQSQVVQIDQVADLPVEAALEQTFLRERGVQSSLVVPMCGQGKTFGYLGVHRVHQAKQWQADDLNLLKLVGELMAIAQGRSQAEIALRQAKESAVQANRAKSEFLANMSHELRTPLNAILGFTQIMARDNSLHDEQQQHLGIINRSGEHLLGLINDILEMSKIEAGRTSFNPNPFDFYHLLDSLEAMLRIKAQAKQLQLIVERSPQVPPFLYTDESKLRQVLINLLGNGIKFTEAGGITLRVRCQGPQTSGEALTLHFEVEDTGPGIASDEIEELFEPFIQTESGRNSQQGTGLGLPISQKFVRLMGGEIQVSSVLDQGSLFQFDIQAELATAQEVGSPQLARRAIALAPGQSTYRILVVDDQKESRLLLMKLLMGLGFDVREAVNGQAAIEIWQAWSPHLIWMDMRMPVMDGYEATRRMKATEQGKKTAIIALTASAFEADRDMVLASGCDDFLRKPFREEALLAKIQEHLGVEYLYENANESEQNQDIQLKTEDQDCFIHQLRQMPEGWLEQLQTAACECSDDQILELIAQIPPQLIQLADTLRKLTHHFQFEPITQFIELVTTSASE